MDASVCVCGGGVSVFKLKGFLFPQLVKLAKRLKKEKVNVDVINFGEEVTGSWSF